MRMHLRNTALAATVLAAALVFSPEAGRGQDSGQEIDPETTVVGRVGPDTIYLAELLLLAQSLPEQFQNVPLGTLFPGLLQRAIDARLIAQAGRAAGYADNQEVRTRVRSTENQVIGEVFLRDLVLAEVTEQALIDAYEARKDTLGGDEQVKARHILLESEEDARAVIAELEAGAEFAELARERSTGPSGAQGGDLGWFGRGNMVPEFSDAAFALSAGEYTTEPVQSQFGWHVILLEERREAEVPEFDAVRARLQGELAREAVESALSDLRESADIAKFNIDGTPVTEQSGN